MPEPASQTPGVLWFAMFLALYWGFCLFYAVRGARSATSASELFVAGRSLSPWAFAMGVTVSAFAGWHFIGAPGLVLRDGLQAGYLSFAAVVVPLGCLVFFKRQWMLSKRHGFLTPGEMLSAYFRDDALRLYTALVALLFAIPFVGLLFGAAGFVVSVATGGWLGRELAMWILAVVPVITVAAGGLRAVAYVSTLQAILLAAGTIVLGLAVLNLVGGFEALNQALARVAETSIGQWGTTLGYGGGDYNALFATPGVIQWTAGLGREDPTGGLWTGVMVLTFVLAFMGISVSPAFSLWAFSARDPRPFAAQQVWASGAAVGFLLFFFVTCQGLGALVLGGNGEIADAGLAVARVLPDLGGERQGALVPELLRLIGEQAPWLLGLLLVCTTVAVSASAGAHMAAAGAVVARDLYKRFFAPTASDRQQKLCGRLAVLIATLLALLMATWAREGMVLLGGLALALGLQLWPALMAVTWVPWLTRGGVLAGLAVGTVVVVLAGALGQRLTAGSLAWGQWPWTIHAAFWGFAANLVAAILGSAASRDRDGARHRQTFHDFLRGHAWLPPSRRRLVSWAWAATVVWVFFGIGPGIVLGNYLFGAPGGGYAGWDFAMPSIWAWQLLWWGLGVLLLWLLAYKLEMSTAPSREVAANAEDVSWAIAGLASRPPGL